MTADTKVIDQRPGLQPKKKRRNKSDLGPNFIAPDGGWGWAVCVAAGFSNFFGFPVLQQFGLIFRDRLLYLGLTNTQITTLFNVNSAISSCSGLFNGPMFRAFTFRQIAVLGSILMTIGLFSASYSNSFMTYILTFSIVYGFGLGISMSAATLAVYTYFKEKRRIAAGIQWTITGIGPIVMPYMAAFLVPEYGVQGSVIIFSGIAFHAAICGTIYQPVRMHLRKQDKMKVVEEQGTALIDICDYCKVSNRKSISQHDYKPEDGEAPVSENIGPDAPMLPKISDGSNNHAEENGLQEKPSNGGLDLTSTVNTEKTKSQRCTCSGKGVNGDAGKNDGDNRSEESLSFQQKVVAFFDLDLLKDFTYVILMLGLTTANFAEMNYSLLTPFILRDYEFTPTQIANTMAVLAVTDVSLRFIIPFIVHRVAWQNKTFFAAGVLAMALGRIVVAHTRGYYTILAISAWIGLGKALRTVFMSLVIPSHVPLARLPAASGLQLLFGGIFTLAVGPLVGKIRDASDYTVTLHCLNIATFWTVLSWWLEELYRKRKKKATSEKTGT